MRSYHVVNLRTNLMLGIAHEMPQREYGRAVFEYAVMPKLSVAAPIDPDTPMSETWYKIVFEVRGDTLAVDPDWCPPAWQRFTESPKRWTPFEDIHKISKRRSYRLRETLYAVASGMAGPSKLWDELRPFVQSRDNLED